MLEIFLMDVHQKGRPVNYELPPLTPKWAASSADIATISSDSELPARNKGIQFPSFSIRTWKWHRVRFVYFPLWTVVQHSLRTDWAHTRRVLWGPGDPMARGGSRQNMRTCLRFNRYRAFGMGDYIFNVWYIRRAEDDVPPDIKEIRWKGVDSIHLAQNREQ
jgi:hypothetical protein